jgi:hypothetical protein
LTKPDSGSPDRVRCWAPNASMPVDADRHAMPGNPPAGLCVRCQSPTGAAASRSRGSCHGSWRYAPSTSDHIAMGGQCRKERVVVAKRMRPFYVRRYEALRAGA